MLIPDHFNQSEQSSHKTPHLAFHSAKLSSYSETAAVSRAIFCWSRCALVIVNSNFTLMLLHWKHTWRSAEWFKLIIWWCANLCLYDRYKYLIISTSTAKQPYWESNNLAFSICKYTLRIKIIFQWRYSEIPSTMYRDRQVWGNTAHSDQIPPTGAVWSQSTLFPFQLHLSNTLLYCKTKQFPF